MAPSSLTAMAALLFAALMAAAALLYPGGSWTDTDASGFSLLRNFWCDLLRSQAINGHDNPAAKALASAAFAALGVALWLHWRLAALVLPRIRQLWVAWLGRLSALALGAMVALPSDRHPLLHGAVALAGGALGISCAVACVATGFRGERALSFRRCSGAAALLLGVLNALLYVHAEYGGGEETVWHPLVQKLATVALLGWILSTARAARGCVTGTRRDAAANACVRRESKL